MAKRRDKQAKTFKQIQEDLKQQRKIAKQLQYPDQEGKFPLWRFSIVDWDDPWGWRHIIPEKWEDILSKLGHFETQTWQDIETTTGSHLVTIKECPNPQMAKRLTEIHQDDIDEIFSLRLSGKERIWGILEGCVLKILWWDPHHEIWPSLKKHT